ncbi:unnamed protein product [Peronospora effusa]|nr:unnamed protein product [Peronospora effusa]
MPDAFPVEYLCHLRDEIKLLQRSGQLYPNATHVLLNDAESRKGRSARTLLLEKHGILETELAFKVIRDQSSVPFLRDFYEQQVIFKLLYQALPEWLGLTGHMIKAQHNAGQGACFPMHFDSYGDDGKCVTAVLYLNEDWEQHDRGEIVLYPFPRPPVVVQPRFGQLVLFSSQQMLHRVMPAFKQRYALTTWMYHSPQQSAKAGSDAFYQSMDNAMNRASCEESAPLRSMVTKVLRSPFRRHLLKIIYEKEWAQSLQESHLYTEAFGQYMAMHKAESQVIETAITQMLGRFRAKDGGKNSKLPQTKKELMRWMEDVDNRKFVQNLQLPWF